MTSTSVIMPSSFYGVGRQIENAASIEDALKQSGLDFTVSQARLVTYDNNAGLNLNPDGKTLEVSYPSAYNGLQFPQMKAIVRDDSKRVLAIMGAGYTPVQNRECVEVMQDILNEAQAEGQPISLFRGGTIKNCSLLFLAGKLPKDIVITNDNGDLDIHQYLVVQWSHTGEAKVTISFVSYCPKYKCFTYPGSSQFEKSVRHTRNAKQRMDDAGRYLRDCYRSFINLKEEMEALASKKFRLLDAYSFLENHIFPDKDTMTARGSTMKENKVEAVMERFRSKDGKNALDVYLSLCEHADEDAAVKQRGAGKKPEDLFSPGELRLFSTLKGTGAGQKATAFKLLQQF